MSGVLEDSFEVEVDGEKYVFRKPSIRQDIEVGYRATDIRRRAYPGEGGSAQTVDNAGYSFSVFCAYLELYLKQSSTLWPYGIADDSDMSKVDFSKPPEVKFENFPADRTDSVYTVGAAFSAEVTRFRTRRPVDKRPAGTEAVAGQ